MPESRACESFGTFVGILPYQPAESAAASGASLQSRSDRHRVATKRRSVIPSESFQGRLNGNGREFEDFLVLQVGVGSAVSASLARQIENAVDWPDRVEGAGVAALERHLARPVVVDPVLVA